MRLFDLQNSKTKAVSLCLALTALSSVSNVPAISADAAKEPLSPVVSSALQAHAGIKEVDHTTDMLQRSLVDLITEVERTQFEVGTQPNAFGSIITPDIEDVPDNILGTLPPRKKWVDYFMKQIDQLMGILKDDVGATTIPGNASADLNTSWGESSQIIQDMQKHYDELKAITNGSKLNNLAIGRQALAMYDDTKKLQATNKKVVHLVRSDAAEKQKAGK